MTDAEIVELEAQGAEIGRRCRAAQGLPPQVEDPTFYGELAKLMERSATRPAPARPGTAA